MNSLPENEIRYHGLMQLWNNQTAHLSSPSQIDRHPAVEELLKLKEKDETEFIKFLLLDVSRGMFSWQAIHLLYKIIPQNKWPEVSDNVRGRHEKLREIWITWAYDNKYF